RSQSLSGVESPRARLPKSHTCWGCQCETIRASSNRIGATSTCRLVAGAASITMIRTLAPTDADWLVCIDGRPRPGRRAIGQQRHAANVDPAPPVNQPRFHGELRLLDLEASPRGKQVMLHHSNGATLTDPR